MDEAILWAMQIAEALDQTHRRGILHRDIKSGNIMLSASGAKLMDLDLAKTTRRPIFPEGGLTVDPVLTTEGALVGTVPYMAPEQLVGTEVRRSYRHFRSGLRTLRNDRWSPSVSS